MTSFPFFDPSHIQIPVHAGIPAKDANPAKRRPDIAKISTISRISGDIDSASNVFDFFDAVEERAAIMEVDAADVYPNRQAAFEAAYEEIKSIWMEKYKNAPRN